MKYANVELHNVCDVVEEPGIAGFNTLRLPTNILDQINVNARKMVTHGSGCEIRGMLPEGGQARITLQTLDNNVVPPIVSVYHGAFSGQAVSIGREPMTITVSYPRNMDLMLRAGDKCALSFDPRLVRVCLPPIHPVRIISIEGDLTYPAPQSGPAKTLLCYGSSITHGAHAIPPLGTYAAQCARLLGYDLINLGVGGSAQMDDAIAQHIASRTDWHTATFEMGINVRQWPLDKFHAAVAHFVSTIASAHPDKHLFCIDLFTNDDDFRDQPKFAIGFRDAVKQIAGKFNSPRVHYVDGRDILRDPGGLQVDMVHPNDNGMFEMGSNLAALIGRKLG